MSVTEWEEFQKVLIGSTVVIPKDHDGMLYLDERGHGTAPRQRTFGCSQNSNWTRLGGADGTLPSVEGMVSASRSARGTVANCAHIAETSHVLVEHLAPLSELATY